MLLNQAFNKCLSFIFPQPIHNITGSGQVFSYTLVLDAHQMDSFYKDAASIRADDLGNATFVVGIGHMLNFFKIKAGNSVTVKAGQTVSRS